MTLIKFIRGFVVFPIFTVIINLRSKRIRAMGNSMIHEFKLLVKY